MLVGNGEKATEDRESEKAQDLCLTLIVLTCIIYISVNFLFWSSLSLVSLCRRERHWGDSRGGHLGQRADEPLEDGNAAQEHIAVNALVVIMQQQRCAAKGINQQTEVGVERG